MNPSPADVRPVQKVLVLGGGSAGLLAALTLKRRVPDLEVTVLRSPGIGIIGVGEGTAIGFVTHLLDYLKIDPNDFYREAEPTWKLGLKFTWGRRKQPFYYSFGQEYSRQWKGMSRTIGFYCDDDATLANIGPFSALMEADRVFAQRPDSKPDIHRYYSYHLENKKLAAWLESACRKERIGFMEATVTEVTTGEQGVKSLHTEDGRKIKADLYVDASGFRSELLGKAMDVPFLPYDDVLYCDRAIVGGWARTDEPVHPYTTCDTMDAGWCWQIEHEHLINRGYVFSSGFLSDDEAEAEFRQANPKITGDTRVVRFRAGRYERIWEKNVVAIGNASGFVEPLEATALQVIALESRTLADVLSDGAGRVTPTLRRQFNRFNTVNWDDVRDFLALHYKYNEQRDTEFWRHCRANSPLGRAADVVELYQENGPVVSALGAAVPHDGQFGLEGYLALLVGMGVPHAGQHRATPEERKALQHGLSIYQKGAQAGMSVVESLNAIRKHGVPA
ncbi:MAG: FAD-dependent oxidoreductase [Phycisphaerales bacterium JB063]